MLFGKGAKNGAAVVVDTAVPLIIQDQNGFTLTCPAAGLILAGNQEIDTDEDSAYNKLRLCLILKIEILYYKY